VPSGGIVQQSAIGEDAFDLDGRFFSAVDEPDRRPHLGGKDGRQ
jgi:hypothetical protein